MANKEVGQSDSSYSLQLYAFGFTGFGQIIRDEPQSVKIANPTCITTTTIHANTLNTNKPYSYIGAFWRYTIIANGGTVSIRGVVNRDITHVSLSHITPNKEYDQLIAIDSNRLVRISINNGEIKDISTDDISNTSIALNKIWRTHEAIVIQNNDNEYYYYDSDNNKLVTSKINYSKCFGGVSISHISCGHSHTAILTNSGTVYTYGVGTRGELGNGELVCKDTPGLVEALAGIKLIEVSAGSWHTLALTADGDVYAWGWNESGQLGVDTELQPHWGNYMKNVWGCDIIENSREGPEFEAICIMVYRKFGFEVGSSPSFEELLLKYKPLVLVLPTLITIQQRDESLTFRQISCGSRHSCAISSSHDLYSWGWGSYGQRGRCVGDSGPGIVHLSKRKHLIESVICGYWNTYVIVKCYGGDNEN